MGKKSIHKTFYWKTLGILIYVLPNPDPLIITILLNDLHLNRYSTISIKCFILFGTIFNGYLNVLNEKALQFLLFYKNNIFFSTSVEITMYFKKTIYYLRIRVLEY